MLPLTNLIEARRKVLNAELTKFGLSFKQKFGRVYASVKPYQGIMENLHHFIPYHKEEAKLLYTLRSNRLTQL